ncbi:hypothetical protein CANINC_001971 [Pichia inconspicua]|uniref:ERCC4 domain-containing protein n=1 Tax=Pichia inconspicua TaxID=52247 RepID=A0A4T0X2A8_9ASCO|nr:hypothetical protein CANINC_001971 [[Candida] inconspicua]
MKDEESTLEKVLDVNLSLPLKFQESIVVDLIQDDALLVLGKGLGCKIIIANLLKVLMQSSSDKRSLIMLINATPDESATIEESMMELWWNSTETNGIFWNENTPKFSSILGDAGTVDRRRKLYAGGGIVSISNRVLVTDILSHVINPSAITGLVILHAEKISQYSMDRFVVNLYRKGNQWGFIKAVSDDPEKFCKGFQPLQTKMKYFKLEKAFLWPRFHVGVTESIQRKYRTKGSEVQNKVTEIRIKLTPYMEKIQNSLMASMEILIAELRRNNPDVASEYWSLENALESNFVQSIVGSLNPVWHRVSTTTKKLLSELSMVKNYILNLYSQDSLTYYEQLKDFITEHTDVTSQKESLWLMIPEASATIACAKDRVYRKLDASKAPTPANVLLEELPKWEQLMVILEEINKDKLSETENTDGPILIACSSRETCKQLENVLANFQILETTGSREYSFRKIMKARLEFYKWSRNSKLLLKKMNQELKRSEKEKLDREDEVVVSKTFTRNHPRNSERRRTRGGNVIAQHDRLMNYEATSGAVDEILEEISDYNASCDEMEVGMSQNIGTIPQNVFMDNNQFTYSLVQRNDEVVIATFDAIDLDEILPSYIICYEPDLTFVRMVELYQASLHAAKCFFMYYGESVEEQMYLNSIKYEKDAFTKLIREKANMPKFFSTEDDEKNRFDESFRHLNSRTRIAGGGQLAEVGTKVIVDMRDFNSQLPFVCYLAGLEVIPAMLTVGDYILTNEICVERKAVNDLIESLENGRLMKQCENMFRWYKKPVLLIEFDEDKSFSFEPFTTGYLTSGNSKAVRNHKVEQLQLRLAVLIRTYPRLSIIWSSSPFETARIFREVKHNQTQPDIEFALMAGTSEISSSTQYNEDALRLLQLIPGIGDANSMLIMSKVNNLYEFSQLDEEQMATIIGKEPAKLAFRFLNKQYK